jgi:type IV secretory pathway TraG/TraD family ATPase VirD4
MRQRETTVYFVLPADQISRMRRLTRAFVSEALLAHFRPGPVNSLFVLDEFRASIGRLAIINDVWSLVRGYGIQLLPVIQSALQLKALFGDEWENYAAQSGLVATLGPPADLFTARWMSERCGSTTILQKSFNAGGSVSSGEGYNSGTGTGGPAGMTANQGGGFNYGDNRSFGLSYQQTERPAFTPNELMDMKPGEGRIWLPGMGTESIPFYAPNYWQRSAPWVNAVGRNPWRKG